VSAPGSQAGGATTSPSELKSLTQYFGAPERDAGRPCYEAEKLRLPWRIASGSWQPHCGGSAKCQHGKESMANSHPPFGPCSSASLGRDFLFFPEPALSPAAAKFVEGSSKTTSWQSRFLWPFSLNSSSLIDSVAGLRPF
jgi:hypothetical protein